MTTICPKCSLKQSESVAVCDCGFDLAVYRQEVRLLRKSRRIEQAPANRLQVWRMVLLAFGGVCVFCGFGVAVTSISTGEDYWIPVLAAIAGVTAAVPYIVGAEVLTYLLRLGGQLEEVTELMRQGVTEPERR